MKVRLRHELSLYLSPHLSWHLLLPRRLRLRHPLQHLRPLRLLHQLLPLRRLQLQPHLKQRRLRFPQFQQLLQ
jgi:hypothetical protein